MSSLIFLVPLALMLGGLALWAFLWSFRAGQYDDMDGAAERIFLEADDSPDIDAPPPRMEQNDLVSPNACATDRAG